MKARIIRCLLVSLLPLCLLCACDRLAPLGPAPTPAASQSPAPMTPRPAEVLSFSGLNGVTMETVRGELASAPSAVEIDLRGCDLDILSAAGELRTLGLKKIWFSATIGGATISDESTAVTLADPLPPAELLCDVLRLVPSLQTLDVSGCALTPDSISDIMAAVPQAEVIWSLALCGEIVGPDTVSLNYNNMLLDDLNPFYETLPLLGKLESLEMCGCGVDDEEMAALRESFPDAGIVWSIDTKFGTVRTDTTHFATWKIKRENEQGLILSAENIRNCRDADVEFLKYCHDIIALDLGHNNLTHCEFVQNMPNLRYLILADNRIADLSPLSSLQNLIYLEIFSTRVTDLSPLASLPNLCDLNLCGCNVGGDLTPLYGLPIERLWLTSTGMSHVKETVAAFSAQNPDCIVTLARFPDYTEDGWRTHDRYYEMRAALGCYVER